MKEVTIYTDGACSGNPGPGGWGAILMCNGIQKEISGAQKNTTNNIMEITAVLEALNHPRKIDENLALAAMSRAKLDKIVVNLICEVFNRNNGNLEETQKFLKSVNVEVPDEYIMAIANKIYWIRISNKHFKNKYKQCV